MKEKTLYGAVQANIPQQTQTWKYTYDGNTTRIASITEPHGQKTVYDYDNKGNLIKRTQLNVDTGNGTQSALQNLETTYTYDAY